MYRTGDRRRGARARLARARRAARLYRARHDRGAPRILRGLLSMSANVSLLAFCFAALLTGCPLPTGEVTSYAADAPELANASVSAEGVWESAPWLGTPWIPFE